MLRRLYAELYDFSFRSSANKTTATSHWGTLSDQQIAQATQELIRQKKEKVRRTFEISKWNFVMENLTN